MIPSRRGARGNFVTKQFKGRVLRDAIAFDAVAADLRAARPTGVSYISVALRRAKRLQFANRFANVFHRYSTGHVSSANFRRHHEANFSAFEFFVELQCV